LKEGPKGGFFMGENPRRADILMEFPMSMVKHRNYVDLEKEFSALDGWLKRVYDRPAFKRCLEKGNGYDFSKLPNPRKL
jgi:glutathione S-transferase